MPSYLVTGAARGLGFGFVDILSADSDNVVIAFVRDEKDTRTKVDEKLPNRSNLHVVQGDLDDYSSLQDAFCRTSEITGGSLDYLIANGGVSHSPLESLTERGADHVSLEKELIDSFRVNVVGNVNLINLALPLLEKGIGKKVIVLTTGLADPVLAADYDIFECPAYSISKSAVDMMVAKYHAEHNSRGLLFVGVSPGVVDTGNGPQNSDSEFAKRVGAMMGKFGKYAPHFAGPISVQESVDAVLSILKRATIEEFGGKAVSHLGNRQWL